MRLEVHSFLSSPNSRTWLACLITMNSTVCHTDIQAGFYSHRLFLLSARIICLRGVCSQEFWKRGAEDIHSINH